MTLRILVNGATGRMGRLTVSTLQGEPDCVVAGETRSTDSLAEAIQQHAPDIVVDFTRADIAAANLTTILTAGACPVIGTSGLTHEDITAARQRFPGRGGIIAPNFSIGAVLMMKYAGEMARYFPDIEIIEMHHNGKLDSPSGTAIRTAEILAGQRTLPPHTPKETQDIIQGARGARHQDIPIHAVRLPGLVAHLQILFGSAGETLTFRHDSIDRQCFMPGVVLACRKVKSLNQLVYGLEHLL